MTTAKNEVFIELQHENNCYVAGGNKNLVRGGTPPIPLVWKILLTKF